MSAPSLARYAEAFERLVVLPPDAREAAFAALALNEEERALLRRMLDADARQDDPLAQALGEAAAQLTTPRQERLGPYRLLRELGAGGMGTVFLAQRVDGGFAQQVAIKLLRGFPTAEGLRRLRRERQILVGLDHPNIARLLDGGETADGQPWLALEYIDGLPLPEYAARHAPRLHDRLALFDAVLDAVGHAHQCLVIHRDIKPANVLVSTAGEVKLLDFGIARLVDLDTDEVGRDTSTRVFSAGYASPEQRAGRAITTASDIYSLGVLLRELVAGAKDSPAPDAELAGILAKATDEAPQKRYVSAGELRDDLERYRDGRPVRAARMTRAYRLRKFAGRHRLGLALGLLALMVLAAFVWRLDQERDRAVTAELAASRDAQRARAALTFLTDAFQAAAPDNALGQTVSVRQLLDQARTQLEANNDPSIVKPLQRLLGRLYGELGELAAGAELLAEGTADAHVADQDEALMLARDFDQLAHLEAMSGRYPAALDAIAQATALRQQHAPNDANARAHGLMMLGRLYLDSGDNPRGLAMLQEAHAALPEGELLDSQLEIDLFDLRVNALAHSSECSQALTLGEQGMERLSQTGASAVARIQLMRVFATAHTNCGDLKRAEALYRSAIAEQETLVGGQGVRMSGLLNDLGVALSLQGRYREAAQILAQSNALDRAAARNPGDYAIVLSNRASLLESAGDYAGALTLFQHAVEAHERTDLPPDTELRRRVRRNQARTLMLAGEVPAALVQLTDLRDKARVLDGSDSIEYLSTIWQLALAQRHAGQPDFALAHLREAESGFAAILPPEHVLFAHALRQHAALALMRDDPAAAEDFLTRALAHMQANDAVPIDIAIARAEWAEVQLIQGRESQAREMLAQALPVLRELLLPTEISRAQAERLAGRWGM